MILFFSQTSEALAREVAKEIGADLGRKEVKVFPDGETYVRLLADVAGKKVVVIHTTRTNEDLIELLFTMSALRENGARSVICVVPHLIYQRQDQEFIKGESVSAKVVLNLINKYADRIYTVNAHFLEKGGKAIFGGVAITNLDAFPLLGRHFQGVKDLVIIAPDEGAMHYAEAAGRAVGRPYDHLIKRRIDGETVDMRPKKLDVAGKNVAILDDIISTGGTMLKAAEMLKEQGAKDVYIGCVHGIFSKGTNIFKGVEVVCTNSLLTPVSRVSLAPLIAEALKGAQH